MAVLMMVLEELLDDVDDEQFSVYQGKFLDVIYYIRLLETVCWTFC